MLSHPSMMGMATTIIWPVLVVAIVVGRSIVVMFLQSLPSLLLLLLILLLLMQVMRMRLLMRLLLLLASLPRPVGGLAMQGLRRGCRLRGGIRRVWGGGGTAATVYISVDDDVVAVAVVVAAASSDTTTATNPTPREATPTTRGVIVRI